MLQHLPDEMHGEISHRLEWRELLTASHTNRLFFARYSSDALWERHFRRYFPKKNQTSKNFKQEFLSNYQSIDIASSSFLGIFAFCYD
jgi:hypothetical protein